MIPIYIPTRGLITKTYDSLPDTLKALASQSIFDIIGNL